MWRSRHAAPPGAQAAPARPKPKPKASSRPLRHRGALGLNRLGDVAKDVPRHLQDAMTQWGPPLLRRLAEAGCQVPTQAVRVGTDCSGLEAPLLALRILRVPHSHVFSSEINPRKRKFIEHNFASASSRGTCTVFPDMLPLQPCKSQASSPVTCQPWIRRSLWRWCITISARMK